MESSPSRFGVAGSDTGYLFSEQATLFGPRDAVGFGNAAFAVVVIDRDAANAIVAANHYAHTFVRNSYVHLGVEIDGRRAGVLQYGYAMNPASADSVVAGTGMREYLELNRMWLDAVAPRNSESRALAFSVRLIRRLHPRVKWIQSFADERCGLFGTVYQAAGFTFHGEHMGRFWELDGAMYHDSLLSNSGTAETPKGRLLRANRGRLVRHELRQFRYLKFLQQRFAKGCRYPPLPYPKPDYAVRPVDERQTLP
jgi:adenine modification enzyme